MAARPWRFNSSSAHQENYMQLPENFFTTDYLFATTTPTDKLRFLTVVGIFFLFIIVAILLAYNKKIHPQLRARLFNFFLTIGILGIVAAFFRYESIPYVGTRLVMLLVIMAAFVWYLFITIYSITKMPKEVRLRKNQERYVQYLPKQKRK